MPLPLPFLLGFIKNLITQDNLLTIGAVGLIFYIIALIFSKTTKCIVIWHWWDLIILAIPGTIFLISMYITNNSEGDTVNFINNIAFNILFVFSFLATITLSIAANIKHNGLVKSIIYIIVVITTKIFITILIPIFIILFIGALNSGEKDKRYKYGRKGNQNIIIAGIIAAVAALLVGSLIKSEKDIEKTSDFEEIEGNNIANIIYEALNKKLKFSPNPENDTSATYKEIVNGKIWLYYGRGDENDGPWYGYWVEKDVNMTIRNRLVEILKSINCIWADKVIDEDVYVYRTLNLQNTKQSDVVKIFVSDVMARLENETNEALKQIV
jgi:hypothetical protein